MLSFETVIDNPTLRNEIAVQADVYMTYATAEIGGLDLSSETITNLLTVEKEDMDLRKLSPTADQYIDLDKGMAKEKFDPAAYLESGKTTMANLADRLVQMDERQTGSNVVDEAITNVATIAAEAKNIKSSSYLRNIMETIRDSGVSSLTPADKMMIKSEISLNAGMELKSLTTSVNALSDVQKEYNSRNFILRLLGPKTRRMGAMLDVSKKQISEKFGVTVENLNEHLKKPSTPLVEGVKETKPEEVKPEVQNEPVKQAVTRQALDQADQEFSALLDEEVNGRDRKMVVTSMEDVNDPDHSFEVEKDSQDLSSSM